MKKIDIAKGVWLKLPKGTEKEIMKVWHRAGATSSSSGSAA